MELLIEIGTQWALLMTAWWIGAGAVHLNDWVAQRFGL